VNELFPPETQSLLIEKLKISDKKNREKEKLFILIMKMICALERKIGKSINEK